MLTGLLWSRPEAAIIIMSQCRARDIAVPVNISYEQLKIIKRLLEAPLAHSGYLLHTSDHGNAQHRTCTATQLQSAHILFLTWYNRSTCLNARKYFMAHHLTASIVNLVERWLASAFICSASRQYYDTGWACPHLRVPFGVLVSHGPQRRAKLRTFQEFRSELF